MIYRIKFPKHFRDHYLDITESFETSFTTKIVSECEHFVVYDVECPDNFNFVHSFKNKPFPFDIEWHNPVSHMMCGVYQRLGNKNEYLSQSFAQLSELFDMEKDRREFGIWRNQDYI